MSKHKEVKLHQVIPLSIRIIAGFYCIPELALLWIFIWTRLNVSIGLAPGDALTIPFLFLPALSLWSIYRPNRYNRWFPFAGILLSWVIAYLVLYLLRLGPLMIQGDDVTDLVVGGWVIFMGLIALTISLAIPALLLLAIPSARRFVFCPRLAGLPHDTTPDSNNATTPSVDADTDERE